MQVFAEQRRYQRYDEIYFSPHLDDVVYSCGGRIAQQRRAGRRVLVVTLFGDDTHAATSRVAQRYGAFHVRRQEDQAALARLDADYVWFNHPDCLFRSPSSGDTLRALFPFLRVPESKLLKEVAQDLSALCETQLAEAGRLSFPLAVGFHPDHRILCDVGRALHAQGRYRVEFYEDIPYAQFPVMVALRLRSLGVPASTPFWQSAKELKQALVLFFDLPGLPTFVSTLVYLPLLSALEALSGAQDRFADEPPPTRLPELPIDDVIEDKVAAIRLYPSQTELLLAMDDRLYGMLRGSAGYVERSWTFPAFGPPSEVCSRPEPPASMRLHRLALEARSAPADVFPPAITR